MPPPIAYVNASRIVNIGPLDELMYARAGRAAHIGALSGRIERDEEAQELDDRH